MNKQTYYALTSIIFGVLAVLHAARLYYGWPANIGGFDIPVWISWFALGIAGYLSMRGWMFVQHKGK